MPERHLVKRRQEMGIALGMYLFCILLVGLVLSDHLYGKVLVFSAIGIGVGGLYISPLIDFFRNVKKKGAEQQRGP